MKVKNLKDRYNQETTTALEPGHSCLLEQDLAIHVSENADLVDIDRLSDGAKKGDLEVNRKFLLRQYKTKLRSGVTLKDIELMMDEV